MVSVEGLSQRLAQAAAMAVAITVGVAALLLFPRPHPVAPAVRVVAAAPARAPAPAQAPAAAAPAPAESPPLRPRIAPELPRHRAAAPVREVRPPARLPLVVAAAQRPPAACRATASEADRLICHDASLAAQDRAMRTAYERALAAGADRLEIDRGQARWHAARDRVTHPRQLAQLYAQRIGELEAAARHPRPPPRLGG